MSTLDWILGAVGAGSLLAVGFWGWYTSKRADALESALAVTRAAAQEWRQAENARRDQLRKTVANAAAQLAREAQDDAKTAQAVGDSGTAAGLLNGLHDDGTGAGDPPAGGVPPGAPPTIPPAGS